MNIYKECMVQCGSVVATGLEHAPSTVAVSQERCVSIPTKDGD